MQSEISFFYMIWLAINIPCVGFGTYLGFKANKISIPVRTSRIERDIPALENIPCQA